MRKLALLNLVFVIAVSVAGCGSLQKRYLDWNSYAVSAENLDDELVNPESFQTLQCEEQPTGMQAVWDSLTSAPSFSSKIPCPGRAPSSQPTIEEKRNYVASVIYDSELKCGQFLDRLVLSETGENTFLAGC